MAFKLKLSKTKRLSIAIAIQSTFFLVEIITGYVTRSLALQADAFHYLGDLIAFVVALIAVIISEKGKTHKDLSFGWQRAQLLGSFFNGVFLVALGVSMFLQSIERFISVQEIKNPFIVLIVGCVGLTLNIFSGIFLHEHDHGHGPGEAPLEELVPPVSDEDGVIAEAGEMSPVSAHHEHRHKVETSKHGFWHSHDLGMAAALLHVIGDALNNIGVIIAAAIIWKTHYAGRFYADPAASTMIAIMILLSSIPLVRKVGQILLQSSPSGVDVQDIKHDLEKIPGVLSVHELHVWRLNQHKAIATGHIVIADPSLELFQQQAKTINECLHAYGVHSITMQPELALVRSSRESLVDGGGLRLRNPQSCSLKCGSSCEVLTCCG